MRKSLLVLLSLTALAGCALNPAKLVTGKDEKPLPGAPAVAPEKQRKETPEFWRKDGKAIARQARKPLTGATKAKNLILFVGDGMSISTVTAARILGGQKAGVTGEESSLSFEDFPSTALAKTYNYDLQSPQAGGSMTALLTGLKTRGASIGLDQVPLQGQCQEAKTHEEPTILEQAKDAGMAAGLVTTARITAAAPAAAYAHASNPNWEVDATLPDTAVAQGCLDIARQLLAFDHKGPLDVVLGGGRMAFLPTTLPEKPGSARTGVRRGADDLIASWLGRTNDRHYVFTGSALRGLKWKAVNGPVLGLFAPDHMHFEADRLKEGDDEPSLTDMTLAAIEGLKRNRNGYVLVVVAGGIGRGHAEGVAAKALDDTLELSAAVEAAVKATKAKDTLIVVTANRGATMTIGGAPGRGSPILGGAAFEQKPLADTRGRPATLAYGNAPILSNGEPPTSNADAASYRQPAALALPVGAGGGEDVPVYARGPGSQWFHGVLDQHGLYWLMHAAVPTLENGKPIKKIAGVTPPKLPKKVPLLPFGKKKQKEKTEE